jgi:carboxymethylenebutenolidase
MFRPPGRVRGGVVVCHEVWGITAPLLTSARTLAEAGFLVVVPDFYARVAGPATSYAQARRRRASLEVGWIREVLEDAVGRLRAEGAPRVGVLGYSMGGAVALWAATVLDIDASVTFYGGGLLDPYWPDMPPGVELAGRLSVPWLGFYGGRDRLTPQAALRRLRTALDSRYGTAVVFDGLDHGFALDSADPRHAPDEAAAAWRDTLTFLDSQRCQPVSGP